MAIAAGEENFPNKIGPVEVLIIEGDFDTVEDADLKVYLHMNDEDRLKLRLERDSQSRNAEQDEIVANFNQRQKSQQQVYTIKAVTKADLIIKVKLTSSNNFNYSVYVRN